MQKGAKILIMDDEVEVRRLLKIGLTAYGFSIVQAVNAQDGINNGSQQSRTNFNRSWRWVSTGDIEFIGDRRINVV